MQGPARLSGSNVAIRTVPNVVGKLTCEKHRLLLIQKPVRRNPAPNAKARLIDVDDPVHALLGDLSDFDRISVSGLNSHSGRRGDINGNDSVSYIQYSCAGHPGMIERMEIARGIHISTADMDFQFSRSGGPGGQNVNKVASRVQVVFHVGRASGLTDDQRKIIRQASTWYHETDDTIRFASQESRSQWKNREQAVRKLVHHLQRLLKPAKKRRPTTASAAGREKRLQTKKKTGETKKLRRSPATQD
jgi:ribosome-associated protein